ncbi:NAD-dependent epimerase/dehydratase family protein [Azospirillum doebereinerae]
MTERKAWITGASGFFGGMMVRMLARTGWRVTAFARHPVQALALGAHHAVGGDITLAGTLSTLREHGCPDLVFHAAGGSHVGRADANPVEDFRRTVHSTSELLHGLGIGGAVDAHIVYPSSAAIYGVQPPGPIAVATAPKPVSHYGWHKLEAELQCQQAAERYELSITVVRFFSLYGNGLRKQLFWELAERLRKGAGCLDLMGTGEETRDYLHIDDAIALVLALPRPSPGVLAFMNGGSATATTIAAAVATFQKALGTAVPVAFTGVAHPYDPRHLCADMTGMDIIGAQRIKPQPLEAGLLGYANWLRISNGCH